MGKNRELTVSERSQIIGLLKGDHTRKEISDILGFPITTVKSTIQRYPEHPKNKDELELFLREEWQQIPRVKYLNLIDSMPRRIEDRIANNGWPTRY
jgi:hypothetical protein